MYLTTDDKGIRVIHYRDTGRPLPGNTWVAHFDHLAWALGGRLSTPDRILLSDLLTPWKANLDVLQIIQGEKPTNNKPGIHDLNALTALLALIAR